jgi:peptidyl-prolyl cis-trans isomerase C
MMRMLRSGFAVLLCGAALASCGKEGASPAPEGGTSADPTAVIARVGDLEITQGFFDKRYQELPEGMKARFSGENWEQRFLDHLLEEAVVYKAALAAQLDRDPELRYQIENARRALLTRGYYRVEFERKIMPDEGQIQQYYNDHREDYRQLGRALGYHIQCRTKPQIDKAWAELERGERFDKVAKTYSEDPESRDEGGLLGWFNRDGYVKGIGFNSQFTTAAFALEPGARSRPTQIGDNWHIIQVNVKTEDEVQPLDKVREQVVEKLRPELARQQYLRHVEELNERFQVRKLGRFDDRDPRTAEQLYRIAAESRNPYAKLSYYQTLVKQYPKDPLADDALFMIGFLYSEEVVDDPAARNTFDKLMHDYPDSEFRDEAEWMMQNIGRSEPLLRTDGSPQDPGSASDRIESIQQQR